MPICSPLSTGTAIDAVSGTRILSRVRPFVLDVDQLRRYTLQLLVMPIGRSCCILLLILNRALHVVRLSQLAVHFGPAHELLLRRLPRAVIIGQSAESLTWRADDVAAATRSLMVRINGRLVRLEVVVVHHLVVLEVSLVLLLAVLLAVIAIALVLHCQFV